jgi:hypothetical protein
MNNWHFRDELENHLPQDDAHRVYDTIGRYFMGTAEEMENSNDPVHFDWNADENDFWNNSELENLYYRDAVSKYLLLK